MNVDNRFNTSTGEKRKLNRLTDAEKELGKVALKLCVLSYRNHDIPSKTKVLEDKLCRSFQIIVNDPKHLDDEDPEKVALMEKEAEHQQEQVDADNRKALIETIRQKTNDMPFRIWNDTRHGVLTNKIIYESQALSGFVMLTKTDVDSIFDNKPNDTTQTANKKALGIVSRTIPNPAAAAAAATPSRPTEYHAIPFICFRGTLTGTDMKRDLQSIVATQFKTSNGQSVGQSGSGFIEMHSELLKSQSIKISAKTTVISTQDPHESLNESGSMTLIDVVKQSLELTGHRGLLICGHSLGGAAATLFFTELLLDDHIQASDESKVRIVTFGSPRTVNKELATRLDQSVAIHLRFVNEQDIISSLPPNQLDMYYHWGKCLFARKGGVYQNYWLVVHDNVKAATDESLSHPDFDSGVVTNAVEWCACGLDFVVQLIRSGGKKSVPVSHMLEDQDGYAGYFEDHKLVPFLERLLE
jgi:hypothetical protein